MRREDHPFKPGERTLIKIEPLYATDYAQARALLRFEQDPAPLEHSCSSSALFLRGLAFWQHWLPCQLHIAPSVYVAKEDGVLLGIIVLRSTGRSKLCWQVDYLIVHPHHRGRGVAQELLRYVFALFGSQGATHFVAEVSDLNAAALALYGSCGFRRCAKTTHFLLNLRRPVPAASSNHFRLARPDDRRALYLLHQEALPPDIRLIMNYTPEDFSVSEFRLENAEALRRRVMRKQGWYWVAEDVERRVLTAAVKVHAHYSGDYHIELTVHPGWTDIAKDMARFALDELRLMVSSDAQVIARSFDFQAAAVQAFQTAGMERVSEFCFLAREHWVRAKYPDKLRIDRQLGMPAMTKPAINLPFEPAGTD